MHNVINLTDRQTDRQTDLDIAKGIGIILVVWAHASGPFSEYINQFHMPMFFFISGVLYKNQNIPCKEYTKRKMKSLLFPFWTWNLIFYPVFFILYYWRQWDLRVLVVDVIEIIVTVDKVPFLGATWFLASLFWVSVVINWFIRRFGDNRYFDVYLLTGGILICFLGFSITFPYRISRTLICSLFYIFGYLYKKYLMQNISALFKNIFAGVAGIVYIIIASINDVSLGSNSYHYRILFIIGALSATFFVLRLSYWLSKFNYLKTITYSITYLGINSLYILIWHFLAFRLAILIQIVVYGESIKALTCFPVYNISGVWWLVYVILGIVGSIICKYLLKYIECHSKLRELI